MFEYADKGLPYYRMSCTTVYKLSRELRMGYRELLITLARDPEIWVFVYAHRGVRFSYFVYESAAGLVRARYGSEAARAERLARRACKRRGEPLSLPCPFCGDREKQWKKGLSSSGRQCARCGKCKRDYTIGSLPKLETTCPRCGATENQLRKERLPGRLAVRCKPCGRCYTVRPDPDSVEREEC
jgi:hypothetical protein